MLIHRKWLINLLLITIHTSLTAQNVHRTELAGKPLLNFPYFQYTTSIHEDSSIFVGIDPLQFSELIDQEFDIYIVATKTIEEWQGDPVLLDVRPSGHQTRTLVSTTIQENTISVTEVSSLASQSGYGLGVGYDVVIDVDRDGMLTDADLVDGYNDDEAGIYITHNTCITGPLEVSMFENYTDSLLNQRVFYPSNIASMEPVPFVVIAHGWYLAYTDYDYIASHLASYGYIVMTFVNDVRGGGPVATNAAATCLLNNTDYILENQASIGDGVLNGQMDANKMVWIGQSTGGECVVRAYTMLRSGEDSLDFDNYDITLISSIAPVSWFPESSTNPYDVNFHIFVGGADGDASGAPVTSYPQSLRIFERSTGNRQLNYIQGAGHSDFDASPDPPDYWVQGPDLIGREATHEVLKGYYLPLVELYAKDNPAAKDFFTRMYEDFHPIGIPDEVIIANEYRDRYDAEKLVIDDYEVNSDAALSSSGGTVLYDVSNLSEVLMKDVDDSFDWTGGQASNGMTRAWWGSDNPHCVVFDWTVGDSKFYEQLIHTDFRNFSEYEYLSFRAAQGTRHPETVALNDKLNFTITLRDEEGTNSSIDFANYGKLTRTYPRTGYGTGTGWGNEFSTVRLRLQDYLINGSGLDLGHIEAIRFEFGELFGSVQGRIGLDDIELIANTETDITSVKPNDNYFTEVPAEFVLHSNFPNPFNPSTTIRYSIAKKSAVKLVVFNIEGQEILTLQDALKPSGNYETQWNGFDQLGNQVSAGMYFCRLETGGFSQTIKMVYLR